MKLTVKENTELKDIEIKMYPNINSNELKCSFKCYECESISENFEHFVGNKCLKCGSYNTNTTN
jgi:hypothetical protein